MSKSLIYFQTVWLFVMCVLENITKIQVYTRVAGHSLKSEAKVIWSPAAVWLINQRDVSQTTKSSYTSNCIFANDFSILVSSIHAGACSSVCFYNTNGKKWVGPWHTGFPLQWLLGQMAPNRCNMLSSLFYNGSQ